MKRLGALVLLLCFCTLPVFARSAQKQGSVIRAEYGSGTSWMDVTERVRSLVHGNSLKFRVNDNTLGLASRSGEVTVLRLQTQDRNGRIQERTFQENDYVKLRLSSGVGRNVGGGSGQLEIHRAHYGSLGRLIDVTAQLNSQIRDNRLDLQVTDYTMGGNPADGEPKTLTVQYQYNGRPGRVVTEEGDNLHLPGDTVKHGGH